MLIKNDFHIGQEVYIKTMLMEDLKLHLPPTTKIIKYISVDEISGHQLGYRFGWGTNASYDETEIITKEELRDFCLTQIETIKDWFMETEGIPLFHESHECEEQKDLKIKTIRGDFYFVDDNECGFSITPEDYEKLDCSLLEREELISDIKRWLKNSKSPDFEKNIEDISYLFSIKDEYVFLLDDKFIAESDNKEKFTSLKRKLIVKTLARLKEEKCYKNK